MVPLINAYFNNFATNMHTICDTHIIYFYVIRVDVIMSDCRDSFFDVLRMDETHLGHLISRVDESNLGHLFVIFLPFGDSIHPLFVSTPCEP